MLALANGCLCCSLVDGFGQAVGQIQRRAADFDHMVIEASGVALPAKIAKYGQMYRLPLDGILVLVDAEPVRNQAEQVCGRHGATLARPGRSPDPQQDRPGPARDPGGASRLARRAVTGDAAVGDRPIRGRAGCAAGCGCGSRQGRGPRRPPEK